jgi:hypothetical protein
MKEIILYGLICFVFLLTPELLKAQAQCTSYDDTLDGLVERIFTAERHDAVRQANFPPELHNVTKAEVHHLNLPDEQWICTEVLNALYPDSSVPDLDIEWALYRVKDFHYLVSTSYETDSEGNRRIRFKK